MLSDAFCNTMYRYRTAGMNKGVRSTNLYHSGQCGIVLKLRWGHIDYTPTRSVALWRTTAAESCENNIPVPAKLGLRKANVSTQYTYMTFVVCGTSCVQSTISPYRVENYMNFSVLTFGRILRSGLQETVTLS